MLCKRSRRGGDLEQRDEGNVMSRSLTKQSTSTRLYKSSGTMFVVSLN